MGPRGWRERYHPVRILVGLLLVLLGAGLAGYLIWLYFITPQIDHRRGQAVIGQLHDAWRVGRSSAATRYGKADAIIEIPRFGPAYQVPVFEGTDLDVLAVGYGHFIGSAGPGQVGNYALAAHRVTHSEPLRNMPDLRVGDTVKVITRTQTYLYRLTTGGDDLVVPLTAQWVTTPLPHNPDIHGVQPPQRAGERLITLTTCAELFHTDNREIAFGILIRTGPTRLGALDDPDVLAPSPAASTGSATPPASSAHR